MEIWRTRSAEAPVAGAPREPGRPGRRPAARGVAGALPGSGGISMKVVRVGRCAASSWRWAAAAAAACPGRPARSGRRRPLAPDGGRSPIPAGRPGRRRRRSRRRSRGVGPGAAASSAAAAAEAAAAAAAAAGAAAAAAAAAASHT